MSDKSIFGPYGNYKFGTAGAVLNACCSFERIPLRIVEDFKIGVGTIVYMEKLIARYRWFDGIDKPLFQWIDSDFQIYSQQKMILDEKDFNGVKRKGLRPQFKLSLSPNMLPAFEIYGRDANPELLHFIQSHQSCVGTIIISQNTIGMFNGVKYFVEFNDPEKAKSFIDYVNENYFVVDYSVSAPTELKEQQLLPLDN